MSKPISDIQLFALLCARETTTGSISELVGISSYMTMLPDRRRVFHPPQTAFDRAGLLGLGRRGLMRDSGKGYWCLTSDGIALLSSPKILARIEMMVQQTAAAQDELNRKHASGELDE